MAAATTARQRFDGVVGARPAASSKVEIDGVTIRVSGGADAKTVAAVIRALKAGA
jgi:hypothetical protein